MSLADVVNRIAQGTQAGKQAIASGASNAEARQAARQAAGVQAPPGRIAMETNADQQFAREQAKADAARKQAQQIIAPGSQDTSDAFSSSGEESSAFSKPDEKEKKESEDASGIMFTPDFIADPNALAMPTGEDMSALTPEEQRQWAIDRGSEYADLMATILTLPLGGIGGSAVKGLTSAKRIAKAGEKASDAASAALKATEASDKAVKASKMQKAIDKADPEVMRRVNDMARAANKEGVPYDRNQLYEAIKAASKAYKPTDPGLIESIAPYGAGIAALGLAPAGLMTSALVDQTNDYLPEELQFNPGKDDENASQQSKPEVAGPQGGKNRSQMQEYYDWLANTDEGRAFAERYGDFADQDLGYSRLRASGNSDAWGYLLGLQGNQGVDNWRNRYALSGVDFSDDATALNNLMDYLYGDGSINILDYMTNPYSTVQLANDADAIGQMARWLFSEYNYSPETAWMAENGLDANDIAMQAIARQVTNNGWGGLDIDQVNDLLAASGDLSKFALVDKDSKEFEDSAWRQNSVMENNKVPKRYGLVNEAYTPYAPYGVIDQDLTAAMMAAYNLGDKHSKKLALV